MGKPFSNEDNWRRIDSADRARQFMPFAALRGYYDLVREIEYVPEPKRTITEEHGLELSQTLSQLKKGDLVTIIHYEKDAYITTTGMVSYIDEAFRQITLIKTHINFDDIWEISLLDK